MSESRVTEAAPAYQCWVCGTNDPLSHGTLCQRALRAGEAEAIAAALASAPDPPVAVPGPADPVVSPADTPAQIVAEAAVAQSELAWLGGFLETAVPDRPDLPQRTDRAYRIIAALLAVGERDRARIEWLEGEERGWRTGTHEQTRRLGECNAARERDRQQIARLTANFNELRLWTAQHLGAIDLEDVDGDVAQVLSSLDSIVLGNAGCTEEPDYTPEQWRVLQLCAVLADEEDAGDE